VKSKQCDISDKFVGTMKGKKKGHLYHQLVIQASTSPGDTSTCSNIREKLESMSNF
jgi:hypothetical protein